MSYPYLVGFNLNELPVHYSDVLVVGSGIAGLTVSLVAADKLNVRILSKSSLEQTSTSYAQGGIAAPLAENDSPDLHIKDTLTAGAGLCDTEAVKVMVEEANSAVSMLLKLGAGFDYEGSALHFSREGGHSVSRILHVGDETGSSIVESLGRAVSRHPNIGLDGNVFVIDLLIENNRCVGVLAYEFSTGRLVAHRASAVVLAAGGMGQIYDVTTNPPAATGDGQAMAARKGVNLSGLEFIQFHPTALASAGNPRFLISETVRGEGAYLVDNNGHRFMVGRHPLAELAPRDIVCQAIVDVMGQNGMSHVYLDARHLEAGALASRFPAIWARCRAEGLDLSKDLIPVSPAAHFLIGGIVTDLYGRASIDGLYAVGEVASTGVHGANRLASNSLLEGVVFGRRAGEWIQRTLEPGGAREDIGITSPNRAKGRSLDSVRSGLRSLLGEKVSVVRTVEGLNAAVEEIERLKPLLEYEYDNPRDWETVNMISIADLIVSSALSRRQSLGVHLLAG